MGNFSYFSVSYDEPNSETSNGFTDSEISVITSSGEIFYDYI